MDAAIVLGIAGIGYLLNSTHKTERLVNRIAPLTNLAAYKAAWQDSLHAAWQDSLPASSLVRIEPL